MGGDSMGGDSFERRGSTDSTSESGSRKLLQMDSGYASMDAPPGSLTRGQSTGEDRGGGGKTASERRRYFTHAGRKGTVVCESFEEEEPNEEEEEEVEVEDKTEIALLPDKFTLFPPVVGTATSSKEASPRLSPVKSPLLGSPKPRLFRRRDYSIDERTEALFNEFLRHDPRLDHHPGRPHPHSRNRSRLHVRGQWQRNKQHSDPGGSGTGSTAAAARLSPSLERLRWGGPMRRGESAGPLDAQSPLAHTPPPPPCSASCFSISSITTSTAPCPA
ncbi:uncharacterized protein LOC134466163 [Engraulis encrasicolus]|uniref:uncharacterized protein LOC134466163 n=1 Tax=Engraulis encrasicolus TaxID=184585 RepID=UPI002FCFA563